MAIKFNEDKFEVSKVDSVATVTYTDDKVFFKNTDISKKDLEAVYKYGNEYITEAVNTAAKVSEKIMEEDSNINDVVLSIPYGISKRGSIDVKARRSHTYPGINGKPSVTKSTLSVNVVDPLAKMSKSKVKALEEEMTKKLLS